MRVGGQGPLCRSLGLPSLLELVSLVANKLRLELVLKFGVLVPGCQACVSA